MRTVLAAAILAAGMHFPAAAQTDPIEMKGIAWEDCLGLIENYITAYAERKGEVLGRINEPTIRSAAIAVDKELVVVRCKKKSFSADFSILVAPL